MKAPTTRFADSPGGKIAYQVTGEGPIDLVFLSPAGWNIDIVWELPQIERYLRRLASFSRLILFNVRGTGPSDLVDIGSPPTIEEWITDYRWVLDAAGSERAAFFAVQDLGIGALLFAATFPDRTLSLALLNCHATLRRWKDYPWGIPLEVLERFDVNYLEGFGTGRSILAAAPELADDQRLLEWWGRLERATASPVIMSLVRRMYETLDVRGVLPAIKAPTLIMSHTHDPYIRLGHGRYLADSLTDARYVEREGYFGFFWAHDTEWTLDEVQSFLTGTRGHAGSDDRVLATVLFTDIVGSTERAAAIGDQRWRELLDEHDLIVRREIERFRGRAITSTGDGILAAFDGPARAIRCAIALRDTVRQLGMQVRIGLHTGEVEQRGTDMGGIAVHIGARVMGEAGPGEVLVSGAVPPLVAGSGLEFDDRGSHELKGVPGEWRLYAVKA